MKLRIPIKLTIFERKTGKMVTSSSSKLKSKIFKSSSELFRLYDDSKYIHQCTITYSRKNDSYTAFNYHNTAELTEILNISLEKELLRDLSLGGLLDKAYIG